MEKLDPKVKERILARAPEAVQRGPEWTQNSYVEAHLQNQKIDAANKANEDQKAEHKRKLNASVNEAATRAKAKKLAASIKKDIEQRNTVEEIKAEVEDKKQKRLAAKERDVFLDELLTKAKRKKFVKAQLDKIEKMRKLKSEFINDKDNIEGEEVQDQDYIDNIIKEAPMNIGAFEKDYSELSGVLSYISENTIVNATPFWEGSKGIEIEIAAKEEEGTDKVIRYTEPYELTGDIEADVAEYEKIITKLLDKIKANKKEFIIKVKAKIDYAKIKADIENAETELEKLAKEIDNVDPNKEKPVIDFDFDKTKATIEDLRKEIAGQEEVDPKKEDELLSKIQELTEALNKGRAVETFDFKTEANIKLTETFAKKIEERIEAIVKENVEEEEKVKDITEQIKDLFSSAIKADKVELDKLLAGIEVIMKAYIGNEGDNIVKVEKIMSEVKEYKIKPQFIDKEEIAKFKQAPKTIQSLVYDLQILKGEKAKIDALIEKAVAEIKEQHKVGELEAEQKKKLDQIENYLKKQEGEGDKIIKVADDIVLGLHKDVKDEKVYSDEEMGQIKEAESRVKDLKSKLGKMESKFKGLITFIWKKVKGSFAIEAVVDILEEIEDFGEEYAEIGDELSDIKDMVV